MATQCEIVQRPAQLTLSVRTRTSVDQLPALMGQVFGAIAAYLGELGQFPAGAPYAAYYNMNMQDLDVEIGFPVPAALAGKDQIQPGEVPGGAAASCVHVGPYDRVSQAYEALQAFVAEQGREPTGVAYEFYLNDPSEVPPEELQTQVVMPLR